MYESIRKNLLLSERMNQIATSKANQLGLNFTGFIEYAILNLDVGEYIEQLSEKDSYDISESIESGYDTALESHEDIDKYIDCL